MVLSMMDQKSRNALANPWLYASFLIALVTSPLLFWMSLVVGAGILITGLFGNWRSSEAIGFGLILGAIPYPLLGIAQNLLS